MTMRERIAKRVFEERYPGADWESVADADGREDFFGIADAVLAELETPTDGMVAAMIGDVVEARGYLKSVFSDKYSAAIRAAREGK
jgi:hypothetical protein